MLFQIVASKAGHTRIEPWLLRKLRGLRQNVVRSDERGYESPRADMSRRSLNDACH